MHVTGTAIQGLLIIQPDIFSDDRGLFFESYNASKYAEAGIAEGFVQDNVSLSKKGVLRGLHYQEAPFAQGKLVQALSGKVLDVAVDIRAGSETFGQHVAVELSGENRRQFFIPAGFAHGFVVLEDDTLFQYKCTNPYSSAHDRGIRWNDPALGIQWGIEAPFLSEKDAVHPFLSEVSLDTLHFSSSFSRV